MLWQTLPVYALSWFLRKWYRLLQRVNICTQSLPASYRQDKKFGLQRNEGEITFTLRNGS